MYPESSSTARGSRGSRARDEGEHPPPGEDPVPLPGSPPIPVEVHQPRRAVSRGHGAADNIADPAHIWGGDAVTRRKVTQITTRKRAGPGSGGEEPPQRARLLPARSPAALKCPLRPGGGGLRRRRDGLTHGVAAGSPGSGPGGRRLGGVTCSSPQARWSASSGEKPRAVPGRRPTGAGRAAPGGLRGGRPQSGRRRGRVVLDQAPLFQAATIWLADTGEISRAAASSARAEAPAGPPPRPPPP